MPAKQNDEVARLLDQAYEAKRDEDWVEAKTLFERVALKSGENRRAKNIALSELGFICLYELVDLGAAKVALSGALEVNPTNELASMGLFRVLVKQGDRVGALKEARRLVQARREGKMRSERYEEWFQEADVWSDLSSEMEELVDQVRELMADSKGDA